MKNTLAMILWLWWDLHPRSSEVLSACPFRAVLRSCCLALFGQLSEPEPALLSRVTRLRALNNYSYETEIVPRGGIEPPLTEAFIHAALPMTRFPWCVPVNLAADGWDND